MTGDDGTLHGYGFLHTAGNEQASQRFLQRSQPSSTVGLLPCPARAHGSRSSSLSGDSWGRSARFDGVAQMPVGTVAASCSSSAAESFVWNHVTEIRVEGLQRCH
ncbi:hypothetical protein CIHG_07442 [Coccidioides immitis H538.4]|uniref:Uncharacterized protein n=1 Tax=Coccidioides immitis H538.4 TaxID=396776 RepID=A0A0J8RWX1_COCIT|nr:hypothetical protein CIHG_07442 [Coccidioides immitis H538.4]